MLGKCPNRRATVRHFVRLPAWIVFYQDNLKRHLGFVRDVSRRGIFFYSDFHPAVGDEIAFVMKFPTWTNVGPVVCRGEVVRVEQAAQQARVGVAARLKRFMILK
jgi:hypothetical protein